MARREEGGQWTAAEAGTLQGGSHVVVQPARCPKLPRPALHMRPVVGAIAARRQQKKKAAVDMTSTQGGRCGGHDAQTTACVQVAVLVSRVLAGSKRGVSTGVPTTGTRAGWGYMNARGWKAK